MMAADGMPMCLTPLALGEMAACGWPLQAGLSHSRASGSTTAPKPTGHWWSLALSGCFTPGTGRSTRLEYSCRHERLLSPVATGASRPVEATDPRVVGVSNVPRLCENPPGDLTDAA